MLHWKLVLISICLINIDVFCQENEDAEEEFVPTKEWQIVKEGQTIPKGLHVRINFETGRTEAKLLDEDEKDDKHSIVLKLEEDSSDDNIVDPDLLKHVKNKFRSYSQLKEAMESINLTPKFDAEILRDLFEEYQVEMERESPNEETLLRILEDYEFLAHQIDNGLEFVKQDGFRRVVYRNLNLTSDTIKQETLKLFGSLMQNNAKVQIHALETGALMTLLRMLSLESSAELKSRAVFALGCLLRRFPLAQLRFIENGGISVVFNLLQQDSIRVQVKVLTLINDLILEKTMALEGDDYEFHQMLIDQYKSINIKELIIEQGWCQYLNKLLLLLIIVDAEDHDSIERCAIAMDTVSELCSDTFNKEMLIELRERYRALAKFDEDRNEEFDDNDFFVGLYNVFGDILRTGNKTGSAVKTEL